MHLVRDPLCALHLVNFCSHLKLCTHSSVFDNALMSFSYIWFSMTSCFKNKLMIVFNIARRSGMVMPPTIVIYWWQQWSFHNVNALFSQTLNSSLSVSVFAVSAGHTHHNISGHSKTCATWGKILHCFQSFSHLLHWFTLSHLFVIWKDS